MAISFTRSEVAAYYRERVPDLPQRNGKEWRGPCPVHGGERDSFAVNPDTGDAFCHSACNRGWGMVGLEAEITNEDFRTARENVFALLGKEDVQPSGKRDQKQYGALEAIYPYTDEQGQMRYQVLRYRLPNGTKEFLQRRPNAIGTWAWNMDGIRPLPYNLPAVVAADFVFVVEGEKDVETLKKHGLTATCNNGGAGKFSEELTQWFTGKKVAIIPDNDDAGRKHAELVASRLHGSAMLVKVVAISGLPEKGDVSDFFAQGGTVDQLRRMYAQAPVWEPTPDDEADPPDPYVSTLRDEVASAGGFDQFWDFSQRHGIDTPYERLTVALGGGLLPGEVYAIGGDTGSGKTSLGLQFITHALRHKHAVLLFSIEMSRRAVFQRIIAIEARVNLNTYAEAQRHKQIPAEDRKRLNEYTREFMELPLYVSSKGSVNPAYLVQEVRARKEAIPNLDLVVVDHLQLMQADTRTTNEYEKFTAISRALKQAAIEMNVPVLVMAQTTRAHSKEKRYELERADIRGSGAIEEDLAGCMLIYPDKDDIQRAIQGAQNRDYVEVERLKNGPIRNWMKLDKSRYGASGLYLPLWHMKQFTRFDLADSEEA